MCACRLTFLVAEADIVIVPTDAWPATLRDDATRDNPVFVFWNLAFAREEFYGDLTYPATAVGTVRSRLARCAMTRLQHRGTMADDWGWPVAHHRIRRRVIRMWLLLLPRSGNG